MPVGAFGFYTPTALKSIVSQKGLSVPYNYFQKSYRYLSGLAALNINLNTTNLSIIE